MYLRLSVVPGSDPTASNPAVHQVARIGPYRGWMSDSVLRRVAAGDPTAVDEILDRYGALVWSIARRFSANLSDAEDGAQDVFIDLWRSAHRYDESLSSEATFVTMVARRRLIDRLRKKQRNPAPQILPDDLAAQSGSESDRAEQDDEVAQVYQALAGLRPEQQRALRLSIYHGMSHEQIAANTGEPLGTVKSHVRRGLIRIRELLGADRRGAAKEGTV